MSTVATKVNGILVEQRKVIAREVIGAIHRIYEEVITNGR